MRRALSPPSQVPASAACTDGRVLFAGPCCRRASGRSGCSGSRPSRARTVAPFPLTRQHWLRVSGGPRGVSAWHAPRSSYARRRSASQLGERSMKRWGARGRDIRSCPCTRDPHRASGRGRPAGVLRTMPCVGCRQPSLERKLATVRGRVVCPARSRANCPRAAASRSCLGWVSNSNGRGGGSSGRGISGSSSSGGGGGSGRK